jgi:hypothetical protein
MDAVVKRSSPLSTPAHGLSSATTNNALNQHSAFAGFVIKYAKTLSF